MGTGLAIISAVTAILLAVVSWLAYRDARRGTTQDANLAKIKATVQTELHPLTQQVHDNSLRLDTLTTRQAELQREVHDLTERLGKVLDRVAILETKIEVFWKAVAMDAAKIIHSPDPRRRSVDELIEAFQEAADGHGTMSPEQYEQLRSILTFMRDWEPGMPSDWPIYPGEQFAAAVLLRTMDHALEASKKGRR